MSTTIRTFAVRTVSLLMAAALALVVAGSITPAAAADGGVTIEFFWGDGCPYCEQQKEFLDALEAANPDIVVNRYEVWNDPANQQLMRDALAPFGIEPTGVPATVIDDRHWIGFNGQIGSEIAELVETRSTVTVAPEVSTGPEPVENTAAVDGGDGEPVAAVMDTEGSSSNVLIGLGVAVAAAVVVGLVVVARQRRPAPDKARRRR